MRPREGFNRMKKGSQKPMVKQPMPADLLMMILGLIEAKFYAGHAVNFQKDKPRLLAWVVFEPARWLKSRGVTITTTRYGDLMRKVIMDAAAHGNLEDIHYLPAWLRHTIQTHLAMHGEEVYFEAKNARTLVENAMSLVGGRVGVQAGPDVVAEFTAADRLIKAAKATQRTPKRGVKEQLNLL